VAQLGELVRLDSWQAQKLAMANSVSEVKPSSLALLVLQPTPFCNLDCRYCYLPDRDNRTRMSHRTLEAALRRVVEAEIITESLAIVWHAGEPLAVPRTWYQTAFACTESLLGAVATIEHHFQTNASLVNDAWCELIARHSVRVGVSVDGPAFLHDINRRTRRGGATHAKVLAGIHRLQRAGIAVHAICVLTRAHLDYPDAVLDFFIDNGIREVGFNIDEIDGANRRSTMTGDEDIAAFARFFCRVVERYRSDPDCLTIREIERVMDALIDPAFASYPDNAQNAPFGIMSVSFDGQISTFSPELMSIVDARLGAFQFGDVHTCRVSDIFAQPRFLRIASEIRRGVMRCRAECPYFAFCRGGAPSNKLGETGRLDGTRTLFCTMTQMIVVETVLRALELDLDRLGA
jgi:uncharacterized protein